MTTYSLKGIKHRWLRVIIIIVLILVLIGGGSAVAVRKVYSDNLRPVSTSETSTLVEIPIGSTTSEIAKILEGAGLIRKAWAFEWYVRNEGVRESLQAGTYSLKPSLSTQEITVILTQGKIAQDLVTILPGRRLDQIRDDLINYGFKQPDVDAALDASNYTDHPALVDKPLGANLEGYLYPESFHKTADTDPKTIIRASLDEMQKRLTPAVRTGIVRQGLTVHEGVILASIVEQEVSDVNLVDRPQVAQVFLRRLREGIRLESNVTVEYGAVLAGQPPSSGFDSEFNTYNNDGLIPTPISNVSETSLNAVANPAGTDYLYFVSGDGQYDGKTYFSRTLTEHEQLVRQYCQKCRI